jgi:hypothetical protein
VKGLGPRKPSASETEPDFYKNPLPMQLDLPATAQIQETQDTSIPSPWMDRPIVHSPVDVASCEQHEEDITAVAFPERLTADYVQLLQSSSSTISTVKNSSCGFARWAASQSTMPHSVLLPLLSGGTVSCLPSPRGPSSASSSSDKLKAIVSASSGFGGYSQRTTVSLLAGLSGAIESKARERLLQSLAIADSLATTDTLIGPSVATGGVSESQALTHTSKSDSGCVGAQVLGNFGLGFPARKVAASSSTAAAGSNFLPYLDGAIVSSSGNDAAPLSQYHQPLLYARIALSSLGIEDNHNTRNSYYSNY